MEMTVLIRYSMISLPLVAEAVLARSVLLGAMVVLAVEPRILLSLGMELLDRVIMVV
jgi:hydrogenase/urease accessory protein HupE